MSFEPSKRLAALKPYAFAEVNKLVDELKSRGITPIDFGVGDPRDPTPVFVREALKKAADAHATSGYPSYIGNKNFRNAVAKWMKSRFNVELNADTEISSSIGSKEAIFNFPEGFINPGDVVIIPSPGYPPMKTGTLFAEGVPYFVPLLEKNNFLIDFESIPDEIVKKAKIIWTNYPNSPTGTVAPRDYLEKLYAWCRKHNIILAADEGCYIDIYFGEKPMSMLEVAKEGVITFYSLSKRNNMTGYRVGWVAGDAELVALFKKLKTNIDSGTPDFVQDAAIAALEDEKHVAEMRALYEEKQKIIIDALKAVGVPAVAPASTFYLWVKAPNNLTSLEFAKKLLDDKVALVVTPGAWISDECEGGLNPGEGYVRFALVPTVEEAKEAAERIKKNLRF